MFDFRRITLFCLGCRLSKHKMTIFSKNLADPSPRRPPGYACAAGATNFSQTFFLTENHAVIRHQMLYHLLMTDHQELYSENLQQLINPS